MGQINIIVDDNTKLLIKKKAAINGMSIDEYCLNAALNCNDLFTRRVVNEPTVIIEAENHLKNSDLEKMKKKIDKKSNHQGENINPKYGINMNKK